MARNYDFIGPIQQVQCKDRTRRKIPYICEQCNRQSFGSGSSKTCTACYNKQQPSETYTGYQASRTKRRLADKEAQAGRSRPIQCEICHKPGSGKTAALFWDHNHSTGSFRGWLCSHCNTGLGMAGDNPKILEAMANYLRKMSFNSTRPLIR